MMPKLIALARRRTSRRHALDRHAEHFRGGHGVNVESVGEGLLQLRNVGDMGEQAQLDLAVVGRDQLVARRRRRRRVRILRPSSVRIGMFCRFGSDDDSRPVVVEASA